MPYVPPSLVEHFDAKEPRTPSPAQFGHDNFLVRLPAETVQKLTKRPDLREELLWLPSSQVIQREGTGPMCNRFLVAVPSFVFALATITPS